MAKYKLHARRNRPTRSIPLGPLLDAAGQLVKILTGRAKGKPRQRFKLVRTGATILLDELEAAYVREHLERERLEDDYVLEEVVERPEHRAALEERARGKGFHGAHAAPAGVRGTAGRSSRRRAAE